MKLIAPERAKEVIDSLPPAELAMVEELYRAGASAREISTVLEIFEAFPTARIEEVTE